MCGIVLLKCLRPEERGKQGKILNACVREVLPNLLSQQVGRRGRGRLRYHPPKRRTRTTDTTLAHVLASAHKRCGRYQTITEHVLLSSHWLPMHRCFGLGFSAWEWSSTWPGPPTNTRNFPRANEDQLSFHAHGQMRVLTGVVSRE